MSSLIKLFEHLEKHPGMYFHTAERSRSIHLLQAFLLGVDCGREWHAEPRELDCFSEWVAAHYRAILDSRGGLDLILEHVNGDDQLAYDEFFRLLPDYLRDRQELGWEGIHTRFGDIQGDLYEALRKESDTP